MSARRALSVKSADPMISEPAPAGAAVLVEPPVLLGLLVLLTVVAVELWLLLPQAASAVRATGNAAATKTDRMLRFMFLLVLVGGSSWERPPGYAAMSGRGVCSRKSR